MKTRTAIVAAGMVCLAGWIRPVAAVDWSHWRGPDYNGIHPEAPHLLPWPAEGPQVLWRAQVGTGFSSLAYSQGRVYTLGNSQNQDTVWCLDANTGTVIWQHTYACSLEPNQYDGGPSATPTIDGDRVYTLSKFGHLFCFEAATGRVLWQTNLLNDLGFPRPGWGFAGSPLVVGEKLLLNAGDHGVALNKFTGAVIWSSAARTPGYSSPIPFDSDGVPAILMMGHRKVVATAIEDGRLLWEYPWSSSYGCADPIPLGHKVLVSTEYQPYCACLEIRNGQPEVLWKTNTWRNHLSPGVVHGNYLFAFHGMAHYGSPKLRCLDVRTGAQQWEVNMPVGSIIGADDKLLVLAGDGRLFLAEPNPVSWTVISEAQPLTGRCWTPPALQEDRLFVRNAAGEVAALVLPSEPVVPPTLAIGNVGVARTVRLSWPDWAANYELESAVVPSPQADWVPVDVTPQRQGDQWVVEVPATETSRFFRLHKK